METWPDPLHRAAVWYLAAFAAMASILLAGTQTSDFVWGKAAHPGMAVVLVSAAVLAASANVWMASRVVLPRFTIEDLKDRQRAHERSPQVGSRPPGTSVWRATAAADARVLEPLYAVDGFDQDADSPIQLARAATEQADQRERLEQMLAAANRRESQRWFGRILWAAPCAVVLTLMTALTWPTLTEPEEDSASDRRPVPVRLTLTGESPAVFGERCTQRRLDGVAVAGDIRTTAVVAFPDQADCRRAILEVTDRVGVLSRRE